MYSCVYLFSGIFFRRRTFKLFIRKSLLKKQKALDEPRILEGIEKSKQRRAYQMCNSKYLFPVTFRSQDRVSPSSWAHLASTSLFQNVSILSLSSAPSLLRSSAKPWYRDPELLKSPNEKSIPKPKGKRMSLESKKISPATISSRVPPLQSTHTKCKGRVWDNKIPPSLVKLT